MTLILCKQNTLVRKARTTNRTYKKLAVHWSIEFQFSKQSFGQVDSLVLQHRHFRAAANRSASF